MRERLSLPGSVMGEAAVRDEHANALEESANASVSRSRRDEVRLSLTFQVNYLLLIYIFGRRKPKCRISVSCLYARSKIRVPHRLAPTTGPTTFHDRGDRADGREILFGRRKWLIYEERTGHGNT